MLCKICNRERQLKYFPKRIKPGTGQVYPVCRNCDPQTKPDIAELADAVSERLEVEVDANLFVRRR